MTLRARSSPLIVAPPDAERVLHDDRRRNRVGNDEARAIDRTESAGGYGRRCPPSSEKRSSVLDVLAPVAALGKVELGDALIAALGCSRARYDSAEQRRRVSRPSVRTDPSRLSKGCGDAATNGPLGVSAEMPRMSSDDEPSMLPRERDAILARADRRRTRSPAPACPPWRRARDRVVRGQSRWDAGSARHCRASDRRPAASRSRRGPARPDGTPPSNASRRTTMRAI